MGFMTKLFKRFPRTNHLYPVFSVIVTLIYGWSLYQFFYILPSKIKFLTTLEIGAILAYTLVNDLFESLLILFVFCLIAFIIPGKWMREDFVFRGGFSALYIIILFIIVAYNNISLQQIHDYWIWAAIGFLILNFFSGRVSFLKKGFEELFKRTTIFLYIFMPASGLALILVLIRNI